MVPIGHSTMSLLIAAAGLDFAQLSIGLLGGLALFLYGLDKMSDALRAAAGDGMKALLASLTKNRYLAAVTGAVVTAIIQSSSVTTVLVVGFITAGLMTLQQSVGVIMGANVGTTITAQIVAFKVTKYALALVAVGFAGLWFARRDRFRQYGAVLMGLGLIFLGMDLMGQATAPLRSYQPFIDLMHRMDNPVWGIVIGAVFTALVQSSSATTAVVIMIASQGFLSLEAGIALALGANIGTCVTALLAAIGKPAEAIQAAVIHVIFNILGVLLWLPFITQLAEFTRVVSPVYEQLNDVERLAAETPRQIANANTVFNLTNTIVLIWFSGPLARLAVLLVPKKPAVVADRALPKFLDDVYLETPALAVDRVRLELGHLGQCVMTMIQAAPTTVAEGTREDLARISAMDNDVDAIYASIVDYVRKLASKELPDEQSKKLGGLLAIANNLESIGDLIETNLVAQGHQRIDQNVQFSAGTREVIQPLYAAVADALSDALRALGEEDTELATAVVGRKKDIERLADRAMEHLGRRLLADEPGRIEVFRVEADIISLVKRLYYYIKRIAKVVTGDPLLRAKQAAKRGARTQD
jgi:phosphate:Na+ symporter